MGDIVLDTNILADFLYIYYKNKINIDGFCSAEQRIDETLARRINGIIYEYRLGEGIFSKGLVIASSFAFVEIARKFKVIARNRFTIEQFQAFIESPPEWFVIETVHKELFLLFSDIPEKVEADGVGRPIEWSDAIHIVTTLSRGEGSILYTGDTVIPHIKFFKERIRQL